ncbi:(2Fe-2S)-binding protein [Actinomadura sp. 6N118]|uniref:(2Fe-2S)-binding protein n=1 Tax=Actinomadura sp. 6N118 TaxID=3375151 RepID=UPI0037AACE0B
MTMEDQQHMVRMTVNGTSVAVTAPARTSLVDLLRDDLALTGTHIGCEQGVCGSCTLLVDGEPVRSCLMLAAQADGCAVTTVEGLERGGELHPVQAAFKAANSFQCGYCSPGFVMTAVALLEERPDVTDDEIREAMAANICRCTGYQSIVDGVRRGADAMGRDDLEDAS